MTSSFLGVGGQIMTVDDIGGRPNDDALHRRLILYVVTDAK